MLKDHYQLAHIMLWLPAQSHRLAHSSTCLYCCLGDWEILYGCQSHTAWGTSVYSDITNWKFGLYHLLTTCENVVYCSLTVWRTVVYCMTERLRDWYVLYGCESHMLCGLAAWGICLYQWEVGEVIPLFSYPGYNPFP